MAIHHSDPTSWPEQLRLPGQVAAPEGPLDMSGMYLMHHGFRRDLDDFCRAVPRTPVDDRETWRALAARWELFSMVLHHHHHGEDTWVWPFLLERVGGAERATLLAMEAEHAEIDPALRACAAGFDVLAGRPDPDARAALSVRLTAARAALARHLAHEESDTIALMQRVLRQPEWEALESHFREGFSTRQLVRTVPWVAHRLSAEARAVAFAQAGLPIRLLWWTTRSGFARRERVAFRYLDR